MYTEKKKPDSRRVQETKRKLQVALLELLQEKSIEHIRVMEIAEQAQMNRTSFYRYYLDVYDLYDSIVEAYADAFQQMMPYMLLKLLCDKPLSADDEIFLFMKRNRQNIEQNVLRDSRMVQKLKAKNIASLKNLLNITENDTEANIILEFYAGGQIGLMTYWLQHFDEITEAELFTLMQRLILQGPMTVLQEKIPQEVFDDLRQKVQPLKIDVFSIDTTASNVMKK